MKGIKIIGRAILFQFALKIVDVVGSKILNKFGVIILMKVL